MRKSVLFAFVLMLTLLLNGVVCSADINAELFEAIKNKDIQKVNVLLSKGADANARAKNIFNIDLTPLFIAVGEGVPEIVRLLLERGADVNFRDSVTGNTLLTKAAMYGHTEIVKLLLVKGPDVNARDTWGYTALMWGASNGQTEIVRLLLEKGADVNIKKKDGSTALHTQRKAEIAKLLIEKGADVNARNNWGRTPLHMQCKAETAELLIEKGADVNARDNGGRTPLMYAAGSCPVAMVKLLLEKGADMNAKNNEGNTALYEAESNLNMDVMALLRQSGAEGGKLPKEIPSELTSDDIRFLSDQCHIDRSDIDIIPKLNKKAQPKLFARIAMRDCKLLSSFKASRDYHRQLKPKAQIPMPPVGWSYDYLTEDELKKHKEILNSVLTK